MDQSTKELANAASHELFNVSDNIRRYALVKLRESMTVRQIAKATGFSVTCIMKSTQQVQLDAAAGIGGPNLSAVSSDLIKMCSKSSHVARVKQRNKALYKLTKIMSTAEIAKLVGYTTVTITNLSNKHKIDSARNRPAASVCEKPKATPKAKAAPKPKSTRRATKRKSVKS